MSVQVRTGKPATPNQGTNTPPAQAKQDKPLACPECEHRFCSTSALNRHVKQKHQGMEAHKKQSKPDPVVASNDVPCPTCERKFVSKPAYYAHKRHCKGGAS